MSNLTTEQAAELTERINNRLAEFGKIATYMPELSPGVVRIAFDEIEAWMARTDYLGEDGVVGPWPVTPDSVQGDPLMDGYHIGYQHGYAEAARVASPVRDESEDKRLVTNDAPAETSIWQLEADPETGRLREVPPWKSSLSNGNGAHAVPVADEPEGDQPPLNHAAPDLEAAGKAAKTAIEAVAERTMKAKPVPTFTDTPTDAEAEAAARAKELDAVVAALQAMAVDGEIPTVGKWEAERVDDLPSWKVLSRVYGLSWVDLARKAGLRYVRQGSAEAEVKVARAKAEERNDGRLVTYEMLVTEIKRIAVGKAMPTQSQFDQSKPALWPTANALVMRLGTSWADLADVLDLDLQRGRKKSVES